jgi:hypothetical protein
MNEMVSIAAASTLALLVLYGTGLVFLLQSISDRYSATILAPLLRRASLHWVAAQVVIALVAFSLIGIPVGQPLKALLAVLLLCLGLLVAVIGSYRTWLIVADRDQIAKSVLKLRQERRLGAVREVIWNAISRSDLEMVERSLRIYDRESDAQISLLSWVLGHRPLANRAWLALALCSVMVDTELNETQATAIRDPFTALLQQILGVDEMPVVYEVVHGTMRALREATHFRNPHGQLMLDTARAIWRVGDHMGDAARTSRIPEQLDYIKMIYAIRRRDIFARLLQTKDREGLTSFVAFLGLSLEDTREDLQGVFSLLWDITADGHEAGILAPEAIQDMANAIGRSRWIGGRDSEAATDWDKSWDESWDHLALQLARALIDLAADDGEIQRMLGEDAATRSLRRKRETVNSCPQEPDELGASPVADIA